MKMSDVFEHNLIKLPNWFSAEQKKYILESVAEHDRLTSENARLRELAMFCAGFLGSSDAQDSLALHSITNHAHKLLTELEKGDG